MFFVADAIVSAVYCKRMSFPSCWSGMEENRWRSEEEWWRFSSLQD